VFTTYVFMALLELNSRYVAAPGARV